MISCQGHITAILVKLQIVLIHDVFLGRLTGREWLFQEGGCQCSDSAKLKQMVLAPSRPLNLLSVQEGSVCPAIGRLVFAEQQDSAGP